MISEVKRDGRTVDHQTLAEFRMLAVKRVVEDGEKPSEVMASLGLCRTSIYPWLRAYKKEGWEGLVESIAQGPEPKLTDKQRQQVRRWILGKDPRQYGFDFGLWTRRIIADLIEQRMGVSLGLTAVGRLLAQMGITPQKPLRRAYERDPSEVRQWVESTYPALRERARQHGASIYFLDEAGFSSEPTLGRTYGLKGQTPVVSTTGQRQKVSAISAVSPQGGFWSQVYSGMLNGGRFVEFLRDFMKGRREKVFLVVDGHPAHKANVVKELIRELKGRLELHFLPPYAPDLNPDEFVWHYVKRNGLSKKPLRRNESLRERVEADLAQVKKDPPLLRSLFRAKSVVYAAD
jgi:transposase